MPIFDHQLVRSFKHHKISHELPQLFSQVLNNLKFEPHLVAGVPPAEGPVLLLSNHPGGLDTFSLLSFMTRSDFHFVAIDSYRVFGRCLSKHHLPVYHTNRLNTWIFEFPRDLLGRAKINNLSSTQVKTLNQKTITRAAQLISSGALVTLFPTGKYGRSQPGTNWKIGLGHLVKQITHSQTQVVFAKIEGGHEHDFIRFIHPFLRNIIFRQKKNKVYFSSVQPLFAKVKKSDTPIQIVQKLEQQYQNFVNSLK